MRELIITIMAAICLLGCTLNDPESIEEREYQSYVSQLTIEAQKQKISPVERIHQFNEAYNQSGLQKLIQHSLQNPSAQVQSIGDLNQFYNDVIVGKYKGHTAQGKLKLKFIFYVVKSLDLTNSDDAQKTTLLTHYTRELSNIQRDVNPELTYECLYASKGKIEKTEYNQMLKKARFQVRHAIDLSKNRLSLYKESDPKELYNILKEDIKKFEKILSDLKALE